MIQARLVGLIRRGHRAASFQLEEVGQSVESAAGWRYRWLLDEQVECRVRCAETAGERIVPFAELWRLVLAGGTIEDVAPVERVLLWEAAAVEGAVRTLDDGTARTVVYATHARDNARGLSALVYSRGFPVPGNGTAGDRVTRWLQATTISGAAGRTRKAREQLGADAARAATAAAAATHLQGEGALHDGGVPPLELTIVETDVVTSAQRTLVSIGERPSPSAKSQRRSGLSAAVVRELQRDAFGSRGDAERTFVPLLDVDEGSATTDLDVSAATRIDVADLISHAGLTPREHEVFELSDADMSYAQIADVLGIAKGTVGPLLSTARRKLEAEAERRLSNYR